MAHGAMRKNENTHEDNAPRKSFWESVVAESLGQSQSSQPRLTAEEDERVLDKALERALLPRKVKRLEEEIKDLSLRRTSVLTEREKKISAVILSGSKGMQYCRELDAAGIKPRRTGSWKDGPGTYLGAYKDKYFRQRVQDEKSKIRRKAELSKTSQALASE